MTRLTWNAVHALRVARSHMLAPVPRKRLQEVVSGVAGIQSQVMSAAELAIGLRVSGVTQADLQDDIWQQRRLVKTYGPRETLHLISADELPIWMAAMRARESERDMPWYAQHGLDRRRAYKLTKAIGSVLDGRSLTREEVATGVGDLVGPWAKELLASTWGELLPPAAYAGYLCFGPSQGAKVTFVRADQWAGTWTAFHADDALRHILRQFLHAYGPAQPQDFARWFGIKPRLSRRLFDLAAEELAPVDVEGRPAWLLASDLDAKPGRPVKGTLRLVPQYDCYVLGYYPRERILPEKARVRVFSYGRGRFEGAAALNVLLIDGIIAGIWARRRRGKRLELQLEPFVTLTRKHRDQLDGETAGLAAFLGCEVTLSIGPLD